MGRLTRMPNRLNRLPSTMSSLPVGDRDKIQAWRTWYKTHRWQKLRSKVLLRDLYTCQMPGCGRVEPNTSLLVADHKRRHNGDPALFWDQDNLHCLCKPCHDSTKQRMENADRRRGQ